MKRATVLLVATLAIAGCGSKSTVDPSGTAVFTAQLLPLNEVPLVTNAEASGSGTATITVTIARDSAGAVTGATANFQVSLTGFPSTTNFTASHIHIGGAGVAGPINVQTGLASGEVTLTNGAGSFTKSNVAISADLFQQIANDPKGFYFNVHTTANGPGVARGQLIKTQ